ncbi:MAG: 4Fe-4S dicluster domain-containing protein [Dehalococcoidales bacterium]
MMDKANGAADFKLKSQKRLSRRDFVKGAAALGSYLTVTTLLGNPSEAYASDLSGWPDRFGMLTDITRCIGCRRCEESCNKANDLPVLAVPFEDKSVFEEKRRPDAQQYTVVNRYADLKTGAPVYSKIQCNHCSEPACVSACLVGALKKSPEGPVTYNEDICVGCRYCMTACPFYIPAFEYDDASSPAIQKCFMCSHRISQGKVPACATECPVEAITFGKRSDLMKIARDRIRAHPEKYIEHIYGEKEAGGTDWLYISGVPFNELGFPNDLGTKPYPELTREFLSAVPVALVVWPAVLGGLYLFSKQRRQTSDDKETGGNKEGG